MLKKFVLPIIACSAISFGAGAGAWADGAPLAPANVMGDQPYESPSCVQADYHEMDFLNGSWAMKVLKDGRWHAAGFAEQKPVLGGCAVMMSVSFDEWGDYYRPLTGRNGFAAILISSYDTRAHDWRQRWMTDMGGMVTLMRGRKFKDGARFVGHAPDSDGPELQRHEWKVTGDNTREFTFEQSLDGGQHWSVIGKVQLIRRAP